jgi:LysR family transcriptional regulator, chromosome initiation inhibitor
LVREKPCTATAAGVPLLRLAAQTALLESEALAEMGGGDGAAARIALAVNADSMARWFTRVFSELHGVLFDIRIEDQDHSARLLREGVVMGYIPVASKAYIKLRFVKRYLPDGFTAHAVSAAPSLAWNRDDALQDELVRKTFRRSIPRSVHFVPPAEGFGAAVRAGVGWGMYPEQLAAPSLDDGSFVRISDAYLDIPLFWQCWKLDSPIVAAVTAAERSAATDLHGRRR